jgi:sec-independent protein translocase protein TatA
MGIENPVHILFIGVIALIVLGPKRLPELARSLGHGLREFREAMSGQSEHPLAQHPATPPPAAAAAQEPPPPVDPAEPIRSGDAPDRGPL